MNLFSITGLLVCIPSFAISIFTFVKGRKKVHFVWAFFALAVALWGFGIYKISKAFDPTQAIFWWKVAEVGVIFIPVLLTHFIVEFLELGKKWVISIFYLLTLVFLFFNIFTNRFVNQLRIVFDQIYYISPPTALYTLFVILFAGSVVYNLFLLSQVHKKKYGIVKSQIQYLFLAFFVGFSGGLTSFLPVYGIDVYPFWNAAIFISALIVTYAIFRYRLMDIRFIIGRGAVYVLSFATTLTVAFLLLFSNDKLPNPVPLNIAYGSVLVIGIFLFQAVFKLYEKVASKFFYYTFYSYQKFLNDLGKKLTQILDLNQLSSLIAKSLMDTMKLDRAVILLRHSDGAYIIQRNIGFKEENGISLVRDSFLTEYLEQAKKPLVYEELSLAIKDEREKSTKESLERLRENMKKIEAKLCLPLFRENKITGMIVLGGKISKEPYSEQDINLLTALSNQASIALINAKLYAQIQDLSQNLQKKVDEQTREIKQAYEVEKRAHQELEKLDETKNQFIMASQHHLRTPLTAMAGYADLILAGSYGKISPKLKGVISKIQTSTLRLLRIVNEFLDISQFQLGKEIVFLQPGVDITAILKEVIEELKFEADNKKIYLKLVKSRAKIPLIKADSEKLKVALFNIFDNAIKYTEKGGVTISCEVKDGKLRLISRDTGAGIPKEAMPTLFEKLFERGQSAQKIFVNGRGIGLFISAQIVKGHNGKIWAGSEGEGKGSTFIIELPVG